MVIIINKMHSGPHIPLLQRRFVRWEHLQKTQPVASWPSFGPYHSFSADPPEGLAGRNVNAGLVPGHSGQEALKWWSQSHPASSKASWDQGLKMQDATNPPFPPGSSSDGQLAMTLPGTPKSPWLQKAWSLLSLVSAASKPRNDQLKHAWR